MQPLKCICLSLVLNIPFFLSGQDSGKRQLTGQVLELAGNKETAVPKVTVSIADFAWDITDEQGFFKLPFPTGRDFVTLVLEGAPMKLLSPYEGLVNLPPDEPFRILVCGAENRRLTKKVNELNGRIARLEKEKQFSNRQAAGMHKILLDTILYYENRIKALSDKLPKTKAPSPEEKVQNARIQALEDSVGVLVEALSVALEERFLRQKQEYDQVSAELQEYTDRLKDLRDRATPEQLPLFFRSKQASDELNLAIGRYNEARSKILDHHKTHILAVRQYWKNPNAAVQLESVYGYLLNDIHQESILPMDARVFGEIRKYEAKQTGRPRAEKKAERAAAALLPELNAAILELEKEKDAVLTVMAKNI